MNRPAQIYLLGQWMRLEGVPINAQIYGTTHGGHVPSGDAVTALGTTEMQIQRIAIRDGQGFHQERSTVVHEVLHALERLTGHVAEDDDEKERHGLIAAFETGLLAMLRENPDLVLWLTSDEALV